MKITIVGLPIGNIEDISLRAVKTLQGAKYLICEDSRMFNNLWSKMVSLGMASKFEGTIRFINDYNETKILPRIMAEICSLESVVLVSDAGMPLISDPGYKLVSKAVDLGWEIDVVPGPTAESAALAVSGLPTDRYLFVGFLPKKEGKRKESLRQVKMMGELSKLTAVIYESPMRIQKILPEMVEILGDDLSVCIAVDLTKVSQKIFRGDLRTLSELVKTTRIKGELVILVSVGK